jgi:hypothetical protein
MNIRFNISAGKFFSSFSESRRKKLDKLQKSVNSINKDNSDFSWERYVTNQDFTFSHKEIHSAIKQVEKNEKEYSRLFADIDFDKLIENKPLYSDHFINSDETFVVSLFKAIYGFVIPSVQLNDHYKHYESEEFWSVVSMSEDLKELVLAELYYRRAERMLTNILSKFFDFRKLITAESPIKIKTYKYFDLIFSLKKEVAKNTLLITQFVKQLFYLKKNEKIYFGNLQAAGRT